VSPLVEGLLAGYGIAIPVVAVAVLIVDTAVRAGFPMGFIAGAGAATADLLYAVLASMAGAALTAALAPVAAPLRIIGGLVLMTLAGSRLWRGLQRSGPPDQSAHAGAPLKVYAQFLGLTVINPLTIIYFTAFMVGRGASTAQYTLLSNLLFTAGVGLASLSWQTLLAALGGLAGKRLSARFRSLATVLGNLLVLALGARSLVMALR